MWPFVAQKNCGTQLRHCHHRPQLQIILGPLTMLWVLSSFIITQDHTDWKAQYTFCALINVQCVMCILCNTQHKHTNTLHFCLRRPRNILSQSGEHTTQSHYNPPHYWGGLSQGRPHSISITGTQCGGNVVGGREQAEHGQRQRAALSFHSSYLPHLMPSITPHSTLLVPQSVYYFQNGAIKYIHPCRGCTASFCIFTQCI